MGSYLEILLFDQSSWLKILILIYPYVHCSQEAITAPEGESWGYPYSSSTAAIFKTYLFCLKMTKNIQVISISVYNQITTVHKPVKQINKFKIIHDKKSPARLI